MEWLAYLIIASLLWHFVFRHAVTSSKTQAPSPKKRTPIPDQADTFAWPKLDEYEFDVVGESFSQAELQALAGEHGADAANLYTTAYLVPENDNPHDAKAVRVDIGGYRVGHLSSDDAQSFRRRLKAKGLGISTTSCGALIMGGYINQQGEKMHYGVRLDIKSFD